MIKEEGFFSKIIDVLNEIKQGPLEPIPVRLIFDIMNNAPDNVRSFLKKQAIDTNKLEAMEAYEIEKILPGFFAADFTSYLGTSSKAYIFIDTYEALWEGLRKKGGFHEKDQWIRDNLVPNMFGVSWVICGRERLLWAECDQDWKIYMEQHCVDELLESYCTKFLEDCGIENKGIQDVIIMASEGVPYYLNLSVDTYEKINRRRKPVPEDFGNTQPEIFNIFVKYLDSNEIRSLEVLSSLNFWDRDLFEILMRKFDPGLPIGAFSELVNFSFIKKETEGKYSIHQLMRKSLQEYQNSVDRKNVHQFMFDYYNNKLKEIDIRKISSEHENALTEAFYHAKESLEAGDLFKWLNAASDPFNRAAFWQLIAHLYEEMLQTLEDKLGPVHPDVAATLDNLALLCDSMGDYEKAQQLYQRVLEINEKVLGPQHPDAATTLNNLAILYRHTGDYEKALPLYQRALEIREKVLGPQHPDTAQTLNNLAALYKNIGIYEKALSLYQRALEIREKVLGSQHPDTAQTLNNLAALYKNMRDYEKALSLYQRALEIDEKVLGSQHPSIGTILNNLAALYDSMGNYEKAQQLYQRVLEIDENVLGPQHPYVGTTLNNLALLYRHMGDYEKALPLYQRALEIREKVLGPQHPDTAQTLNNLAALYDSMGDYEKALSLYQRALEIREKILGSQHPNTAQTLNNLAVLYKNMGDYKKALPLYQRALEIREKALGPQHPSVASIINNLVLLYNDMGDYEKALSLYQRAGKR